MQSMFEIATRVSTPLALAGLFAAIIFFSIRQILAKNLFPVLTRALSGDIIKLIIERLFVLSLVAMILGFVGFIIPRPTLPVLPISQPAATAAEPAATATGETSEPAPSKPKDTGPPSFRTDMEFSPTRKSRKITSVGFDASETVDPEKAQSLLKIEQLEIDVQQDLFRVILSNRNPFDEELVLELEDRFFSLADDTGLQAELIYSQYPKGRTILAPGDSKRIILYFKRTGWIGKSAKGTAIIFSVRGLLPVVRASWSIPMLKTED